MYFFFNSRIVFEFFTMHSLIAHRSEKISESKRSSIFKLARNLHFSVGSSFILQFYAEIRNFPHEKSIRNCGRDGTEMQSRSSRDIPSAKLEEVVRSAMVAFMRDDSASGCPGETGSPCAACTGVMAHAGSRFPSLPLPRMLYAITAACPIPSLIPRPPHLRRSLTQRLGVLADRMTLRILIRPFTESERMHIVSRRMKRFLNPF